MNNVEQRLTIEDYHAVLDNIDDGIFVIDTNGIILEANKAVEKNGGKKIEELIGRNIDALVDEGYCTEFVSKRVILSGKEEVLVQRTKDNRELLVTGVPYYENGKFKMVIACERDVTELSKTKEKLLKVKDLNEKYEKEIEHLRQVNGMPAGIISVSKNMKQTVDMARKVSKLDATVLIQGESGTGKEVLANLICKESPRADKPFIKVNCGAIPGNLLESEMFGYVEGAFTGARKQGKSGYFGMANGGTIFLDEIDSIPFNLQVKLLRVIQEREMMPVGSDTPVKLDIRIIAATNKDLKEMVNKGEFRQDLYYRIGVVSINIPPLRERKEDIVQLVRSFVDNFNKKHGTDKRIDSRAKKRFMSYSWPGNVRELENMIESLIVISDGDVITERDVSAYISKELKDPSEESFEITGSIDEMVRDYEAGLLRKLYSECRNTGELAERLNTTRSTINRKLAKYGIRDEE